MTKAKREWRGTLKLGGFSFKAPKLGADGVVAHPAYLALKCQHTAQSVQKFVEFLMANGRGGLHVKLVDDEGGEEWKDFGRVPSWTFVPPASEDAHPGIDLTLEVVAAGGDCSKLEKLAALRIDMAGDKLTEVEAILQPHQLDFTVHGAGEGDGGEGAPELDWKSKAAGERAD